MSFTINPSADRDTVSRKQYEHEHENAKPKESSTKEEVDDKDKSISLEKQTTSFNNGLTVSLEDTEDLY